MKILVRFLVFVVGFVAIWMAMAQINWIEILHVQQASDKTEKELTRIIKESIERTEEIIKDSDVKYTIDSIVDKLAKENYLDAGKLTVMVVNNPQVNAFALPDDHIIIYSGLIKECGSAEALSGVIAHEMAHLELNHVMKKLVKEVGVSVLVSMTSSGGGQVIQEVTSTLTSSAYDRSLEAEADEYAVHYLLNADINPNPLADFFYQLALNEPEFASELGWLSTHPDSKERALEIIEQVKNKGDVYRPVISESSWNLLLEKVEIYSGQEL
ncbi:peptidase M48 [Marivirga lumbricoides]|uniref:Peptidase M48 n=1 Tax=Marivirga lumbricoides TaxID=1046115 RepID=A0ABQ1MLM4_9BACT|nr:peptidase M48 [Marivirga lumbricoides]